VSPRDETHNASASARTGRRRTASAGSHPGSASSCRDPGLVGQRVGQDVGLTQLGDDPADVRPHQWSPSIGTHGRPRCLTYGNKQSGRIRSHLAMSCITRPIRQFAPPPPLTHRSCSCSPASAIPTSCAPRASSRPTSASSASRTGALIGAECSPGAGLATLWPGVEQQRMTCDRRRRPGALTAIARTIRSETRSARSRHRRSSRNAIEVWSSDWRRLCVVVRRGVRRGIPGGCGWE
jgi:hypothetical protein